MSYYFIAYINISDKEEYKKYTDRVTDSVEKHNGKYLAVDTNPTIIEGNPENSRCVIIAFPTKKDFNEWYNSKVYQEILPIRLNSATSHSILVKGLDEIK